MADADDDRDLDKIICANEIAKSGVRGNMKEFQGICEEEGKAMATFAVKVIDLSQVTVKTKLYHAFLMDRNSDLVLELDKSRPSERLTCDKIRKAEACVKALAEHVKAPNAKDLKSVDDTAQIRKERCIHVVEVVAGSRGGSPSAF